LVFSIKHQLRYKGNLGALTMSVTVSRQLLLFSSKGA
jgi:hypothetical protein